MNKLRNDHFRILWTLVLCFFFGGNATGQVYKWLETNQLGGLSADFENFPFSTYQQMVSLDDIRQLETDRALLNLKGYDGNHFVQAFLKHSMESDTLDFTDYRQIHQFLALGQTYFYTHEIVADSTYLYAKLSDKVFSKLSQSIQAEVESGKLDLHAPEVVYWITALAQHQYLINFETSQLDKGWYHLKNGNIDYVIGRIWLDYAPFVIGGILFLVLLVGGLFYKVFRAKNRTATTAVPVPIKPFTQLHKK